MDTVNKEKYKINSRATWGAVMSLRCNGEMFCLRCKTYSSTYINALTFDTTTKNDSFPKPYNISHKNCVIN